MGILRFFFKRHPKKPYKAPKYTQYSKSRTLKSYGKNPTPDRKVSRVRVPKERQDGLFSAMLNEIFRKNHKGGQSGGRS